MSPVQAIIQLGGIRDTSRKQGSYSYEKSEIRFSRRKSFTKMLPSLLRSTVCLTVLCHFIVLFDTTDAAVEFISAKELVEKIIIDSVPPNGSELATSTAQPEETPAGSSSTQQLESSGLCAQAETSKLAFCDMFLRYELLFDFSFEAGTAAFVCERRKITLTTLHQDNLNGHDQMDTYRCPRVVQSVLLAHVPIYYVSQPHDHAPAILYTRINSHTQLHPYKAVTNVDLAALAAAPAPTLPYYPQGQSLLEPMDLSRHDHDVHQLVQQAQRLLQMRSITRAYEKFVAFFHSFDVCGMTTTEKLFACKYYVSPREDPVATSLQMEAEVDLHAGKFAYKGSECRRHETALYADEENQFAPPLFEAAIAQFRCPPTARYELQQQGSSSARTGGAPSAKIYFDHTARLLSAHYTPSTAFLMDARHHQVKFAATVSGVVNRNMQRLAAMRREWRWRREGEQPEGRYQPARQPDQYQPYPFIEMSRDRAEQVIYQLKGHAKKTTHERFAHTYPRISLAAYKTQQQKVDLCNAVFGHQAFGYVIEAAQLQRRPRFEIYVNRLEADFHIDDRNKWLPCFSCTPSTPTIYADLYVAAGTDQGGVVVLVRDFKTEILTPFAVAYPDDPLTRAGGLPTTTPTAR